MLENKNTTKIAAITVLIAAVVILGIIGIKALMPAGGNLKSGIYPRVVSQTDSIYFSDSSDFAKQYRWAFGDGSQSFTPAGYHHYNAPGNYTVTLTVNNKFTDTFFVSVNAVGPNYSIADSVMKIEGPDMAMQGENLVFRAKGKGDNEFRWEFGDNSSMVASNSDIVQYAYQNEGEYLVRLYSKNSQYPATHKITIVPSYKSQRDSLTNLDAIYQDYEIDFKYHLQQIANGGNFNEHYYYLLRKYLCGNEKAVMKINDQKINDFNSYCLGLQFDNGILIQRVKLVPDDDLKCMKMAEIKQEKKL